MKNYTELQAYLDFAVLSQIMIWTNNDIRLDFLSFPLDQEYEYL